MTDLAANKNLDMGTGRDAFGTPTFRPLVDGVVASVAFVVRRLSRAYKRHAMINRLRDLDDRLLDDIGIQRWEIEAYVDRVIARLDAANENEPRLAA